MNDFLASHINSLVTVKEDKLLETLCYCLNECVVEPKNFKVENLTDKEFLELMLAMKIAFDSKELEYYFYHSCQDNIPEKLKKASVDIIRLDNVKMISIEQSDEILREFVSTKLKQLDEESYKQYLILKYGYFKNITIEEEVKTIKVKEPIYIKDYDNIIYEFRFVRIKDLIEANRIVSKEYDHKIRIETNKPIPKSNQEEAIAIREEIMEELKRKKAERFIEVVKNLCLVAKTVNNKRIVFENTEQKLSEKINRKVYLNYMNAVSEVKYGIEHEVELHCNLCDSEEPQRGYLQRLITPLHLLPVSITQTTTTERKSKINSRLDFYF
jgi:hypothetical protein